MLLDIVILPPVSIRKELGRMSVGLSKVFKPRYVVDNDKLIPHLSIFHINIKPRDLDRLVDVVNGIVYKCRPFVIESSDLEVSKFSVGLKFSLLSSLKKLNDEVVKKCAYLRQGIMPLNFKKQFSTGEKIAIEKYGTYGTVGPFYKPHITLNVLIKPPSKIALSKINFNFRVDELAVCRVNKYYQVTKILKTFKLN